MFVRGKDTTHPDWASWVYQTVDNPYIDPDEIEEARQTLPARFFAQEYLAEFIEDAGGVFRGVDAVSTGKRANPYPGRFVAGVDWARSHDYTVISVFDRETNTEVDLDRFNQISWALQRGRLETMYQKWNIELIVAEENSIGSPNIEALQGTGLPVRPFQTTPKSKAPLIDALALAVEQRDVTLINDPVAMLEMKAYQMTRLPGGAWRYDAPDGGHDDTVIARALAWHGVTLPRLLKPVFI
jgi:hypothetical protein